MRIVEYGCAREFNGVGYSASGFESREAALESVYGRAFQNGDWKPRKLRAKWWQFWRPKEHNEIERKFV